MLEELGADAYVFFEVDAPPVVVEEALREEDEESTLFRAGDRTLFSARVDPRTAARIGQRMTLAVDPSRFYFFAPQTGESLVGARAASAASA